MLRKFAGEDLKTNLSTLRFFEIFVTLICTIGCALSEARGFSILCTFNSSIKFG